MGMPLTSYTLLYALCSNKGGYELEMAKKILEPFNLIAFILHIPDLHPEFDRYLNKNFDRLDYLTGPKLLFFSLCDPPCEWLSHAKDRQYYRHFNSWEVDLFMSNDSQILTDDKSSSTLALCSALGITIEEMPCIVITRKFSSAELKKIPTNQTLICDQIAELGYIAKRDHINGKITSLNDINLNSIKKIEYDQTNILEITLAQALSEALSFIVAGSNRNSGEKKNAVIHANQILIKLLKLLQKVKNSPELNEENNILDDLCFKISTFLSNIKTYETESLFPFDKKNFDKDSFCILKTALKVTQLLSSDKSNKNVYSSIPPDLLDFTPGIICFAKVFEKEINLSIVQWIRKYLGINFPEYYNRPQPNIIAQYVPLINDPQTIDFNLKRNNQLRFPGIGQTELVFNDLYCYLLDEYQWNEDITNHLKDSWRNIRLLRNKAGHTEVMNEPELDKIKSIMKELETLDIFKRLTTLKEKLKN